MNILVVHNRYAYAGGEDEAFATEIELLRSHGHNVVTHVQDNKVIADVSRMSVVRRAFWSSEDYKAVRGLIRQHNIDVMSVHNFFPLISPAIFYAAAAEKVASIQTLHNYRLLCPGGTFLRDGKVCEECLGSALPWKAALHRCYRGSRVQSAVTAGMLSSHRLLGTWSHMVTRYLALTAFMRDKMIAGGLPAERIVVKPNSVEETGLGTGEGDDFLFVGRLSPEKGVDVLLRAWGKLRASGAAGVPRRLRIVGTGPKEIELRAAASGWPEVRFLGHLPGAAVREEIGNAAAVILPSIWYEGLSRVMTEAFSKGTPVIASDIGPIGAAVRPGDNGVLFRVGDDADLAEALARFPARGDALSQLRSGARADFDRQYASGVVYAQLMEIYAAAIAEVRGGS
ncbi:Glycosyltransferase involved in cell wall bisynthesis [Bryocella elongata]|uniref:Glycosyltransferase involved in cell wall bisynthesis n=1 Tax=Bryocella elongata TaxID=863522 RepID=A0A1H5SQW7_9BACT|nr:glycosyltransferase [Bryocella elongata]SEF52945.1 Glycosyltransferase involved in cell wall bisynthesis [Bryocella elongata]